MTVDEPWTGPGRGAPSPEHCVPDVVRSLSAGHELVPVWENEAGGLTYRFTIGDECRYVKWSPLGNGIDLRGEVARLLWAAPYTRVPEVLDHGTDHTGSWIVTRDLGAPSAVEIPWRQNPAAATTAIGAGLRAMHDAMPIDQCPFTWARDDRFAAAREWVTRHPDFVLPHEFEMISLNDAIAILDVAPTDDLVVCHGDPCAPNTLVNPDGTWAAHVDFGALGVADRWADIAVATWSAGWNYGWDWQQSVLDAYGIDLDREKMTYYRLLWALG